MSKASLTTSLVNIEYLSGFKSSNAFLLQCGNKNYLFTDGRYLEKAHLLSKKESKRIGKFEVYDVGKDLRGTLDKIAQKHRIQVLAFDEDHLTVAQLRQFKRLLKKGIRWETGSKHAEKKRAQKDRTETNYLKRSQAINEQVFYSIKSKLKPGISELEIGCEIKKMALEYGASDISFEPIVAFGNHSSMPHHQNTERKLKKGDMVLIDMGVLFKGYASDMTRMAFTAKPTPLQERIYQLVLEAQEAAIQAMKPGVACSKLDQIARKILKAADYEDKFTHALGHGIGLEVHEAPTLSSRSKDTLKTGMVVTSEPGLYLPGEFGVRIEDMVLITAQGHENLTKAKKQIKDCILR